MVKHTQGKSQERPIKKARVEAPSKRQSRTKENTLRPKLSQKVAKEGAQPLSPSAKGKEKEIKAPTEAKSKTKVKKSEEQHPLPTSFKIVAGSYEKLLYGLEGTVTFEDSKLQFQLKPTFIFPAHVSCIKAVAASPHGGKWLATGSADEIIKVWDLRRRKEIGGLMHHEGTSALYTTPLLNSPN
jgi:protein MAK11